MERLCGVRGRRLGHPPRQLRSRRHWLGRKLKGGWLKVWDAVKVPLNENAPYPAGLYDKTAKVDETEHPAAGLVDDAAVHEMPALPGDEEVAAIAAEQEAGAIETEAAEAAAEVDAADAAQSADNEKAAAAEASDKPANADDGKEG